MMMQITNKLYYFGFSFLRCSMSSSIIPRRRLHHPGHQYHRLFKTLVPFIKSSPGPGVLSRALLKAGAESVIAVESNFKCMALLTVCSWRCEKMCVCSLVIANSLILVLRILLKRSCKKCVEMHFACFQAICRSSIWRTAARHRQSCLVTCL